ncbi:MAG: ComEA family DNA-binding protein [Desulfobaccales bacterium]
MKKLPCFSRSQLGVILLLGAALLLLWAWRANFGLGPSPAPPPGPDANAVFVEVRGPLSAPGVYSFDHLPTLTEVWRQAGGPGVAPPASDSNQPDQTGKLTSGSLITITPDRHYQLGRMAGAHLLTLGLPLELNTASADDLAAIPGVGPALAQAIVSYRTTYGPFRTIDDLLKVSGVGPKKLENLRPHLVIPESSDRVAARH